MTQPALELGCDEFPDRAKYEVRGSGLKERSELHLKLVFRPKIIVVEERDVVATDRSNASVACSPQTLMDQRNATDFRCKAASYITRGVGGPVVDYDDVECLMRLAQDAMDRIRKVALPVVCRNHNPYDRGRIHLARSGR